MFRSFRKLSGGVRIFLTLVMIVTITPIVVNIREKFVAKAEVRRLQATNITMRILKDEKGENTLRLQFAGDVSDDVIVVCRLYLEDQAGNRDYFASFWVTHDIVARSSKSVISRELPSGALQYIIGLERHAMTGTLSHVYPDVILWEPHEGMVGNGD